jgi:hypothetical protein
MVRASLQVISDAIRERTLNSDLHTDLTPVSCFWVPGLELMHDWCNAIGLNRAYKEGVPIWINNGIASAPARSLQHGRARSWQRGFNLSPGLHAWPGALLLP